MKGTRKKLDSSFQNELCAQNGEASIKYIKLNSKGGACTYYLYNASKKQSSYTTRPTLVVSKSVAWNDPVGAMNATVLMSNCSSVGISAWRS